MLDEFSRVLKRKQADLVLLTTELAPLLKDADERAHERAKPAGAAQPAGGAGSHGPGHGAGAKGGGTGAEADGEKLGAAPKKLAPAAAKGAPKVTKRG